MDYLLRDDAPFSGEVWEKIDNTVIKTFGEQVIGRKFIPIYGPLGPGTDSINVDELEGNFDSVISFDGDEETTPVKVKNRKYVEIPMLLKDFSISWRDLERSKQSGLPLDMASVAMTAAACAQKEDSIIFWGNKEYGYPGLMTVEGRQVITKSDWSEGENAFKDVASALEKLVSKGFYGPYTLIVSPSLYLQMQRIQPGTGRLEIERMRDLLGGKIYQSPVLNGNEAVLLEKGMQNMDLVVGQDLVTAYMGPEKLNHVFRILETLTLRIKRPNSIVTFE